jgi:hypothetical protein
MNRAGKLAGLGVVAAGLAWAAAAAFGDHEKAMEASVHRPAGTYGTWPAGRKHFVRVKGETVAQFHSDGPWMINYLNPADDPRNKKK